jgi:hypothetical protein
MNKLLKKPEDKEGKYALEPMRIRSFEVEYTKTQVVAQVVAQVAKETEEVPESTIAGHFAASQEFELVSIN